MKNNCFSNLTPCSGCGACYAVCPVSAIAYNVNSTGFYEARVDENKCIECGKCVKVCPKYVQDQNQLDKNTFPVYSFVHKDPQVLAESSSGAAAWALTQIAVEKGYEVVGVSYNYTSNTAQASIAKTLSQAKKFKGSKYIQADTQIYKELLQKPGKFLIFGTPCQLAGLARAVEEKGRRSDFLLVDCFCHGVPSYQVWHKFLKQIDMTHPSVVEFRAKQGGWHNFCMRIKAGPKTYQADVRRNPFYQLFFSDLLLNEACYTCRVKSAAYADIRLGDFWGKDYDLTDEGVSLVLPLSAQGRMWLEQLATAGTLKDIGCWRHKIVKSQSAFAQTPCKKEYRRRLLSAFAQQSFDDAFALYWAGLSNKKKWAIKLKSMLPLALVKYVRFVTHKLKGY